MVQLNASFRGLFLGSHTKDAIDAQARHMECYETGIPCPTGASARTCRTKRRCRMFISITPGIRLQQAAQVVSDSSRKRRCRNTMQAAQSFNNYGHICRLRRPISRLRERHGSLFTLGGVARRRPQGEHRVELDRMKPPLRPVPLHRRRSVRAAPRSRRSPAPASRRAPCR